MKGRADTGAKSEPRVAETELPVEEKPRAKEDKMLDGSGSELLIVVCNALVSH